MRTVANSLRYICAKNQPNQTTAIDEVTTFISRHGVGSYGTQWRPPFQLRGDTAGGSNYVFVNENENGKENCLQK